MSVTKWLAVSVVANIALVGFVAIRHSQPAELIEPSAQISANPSTSSVVPLARGSAANTQFDPDKALVLARLEYEARDANPPPRIDYWRTTGDAEFARYEEDAEQQREAMRRQLLAQYGPTATDDSAFTRLFKPMNATHAYLSSKGQLALAKLQRARRFTASAPPTSIPAGPVGGPDVVRERQRAFEAEVRRTLGDEYAEYQVHNSPLARQLRGTGVIESERQFRDVFAALEQLGSGASPEVYSRVQGKVKALLGEARYAQFSAARDPGFPAMEAAGTRQRLSRKQILAAYSVVVRAQNELTAALIERDASGASRPGAEPQQIIEARDAEIARLVGEPAATEMLQAHSNGMVAASLHAMDVVR